MVLHEQNLQQPEDELASVRAERDELLAIFHSSYDEIFVTDGCGKTLWVNKACERLYGLKAEDIIGKNVKALEKEGLFSPSMTAVIQRDRQRITRTQATKRGRIIEVTGNPVFDEKGDINRIVYISRDITELSNLRKRLQETEMLMDSYRTELVGLQKERVKSDTVVTCSDLMEEILALAEKLAQVNSTVLITGESGVGKSVIASFIHKHSPRQKGAFITINCGAIPENLIESELFGYEAGAFTGARKEGKKGLLELAHCGTIFLDEVGELPLNLQVKLLQVIQEKSLMRVGGQQLINVDIRIIAATNRNLDEMVKRGAFREDLFYRLNVVPVRIPPLRERGEDVALLLGHFLAKYAEKYELSKRISPEAMEILMEYGWPGNVRELENIVERLVVTTDGAVIYPQHLPDYVRGTRVPGNEAVIVKQICTMQEGIQSLERQLLKKAYDKFPNTYKVAELLGVNQSTVVRKRKKYLL